MDFDVDDFRRRYPEMRPWEGERYGIAREHNCALIIIGESHYLPETSIAHKDCDAWYASDDTKLNAEEKKWINTSNIVKEVFDKLRQKQTTNKAHSIFTRGYEQINQCGPKFAGYWDLFPYTVCYNFFLRPANEGVSFNNICTQRDRDIANAYFSHMVEQYQPNGIIFLSQIAFEISCLAREKLTIPIAGAPHPGCKWWNMRAKKYGGRLGRELVQDGMKGMDWSWIKSNP